MTMNPIGGSSAQDYMGDGVRSKPDAQVGVGGRRFYNSDSFEKNVATEQQNNGVQNGGGLITEALRDANTLNTQLSSRDPKSQDTLKKFGDDIKGMSQNQKNEFFKEAKDLGLFGEQSTPQKPGTSQAGPSTDYEPSDNVLSQPGAKDGVGGKKMYDDQSLDQNVDGMQKQRGVGNGGLIKEVLKEINKANSQEASHDPQAGATAKKALADLGKLSPSDQAEASMEAHQLGLWGPEKKAAAYGDAQGSSSGS